MSSFISLDTSSLKGFVTGRDFKRIFPKLEKARRFLETKNGHGRDLLGWLDLPEKMKSAVNEIRKTAEELNAISDVIAVIGVGGSYLGAKATIEMLKPRFGARKVVFIGNSFCSSDLSETLDVLGRKRASVIVVSKSGGTAEPAAAFAIIKDLLGKKYGPAKLRKRVVCVTDAEKGTLRRMASFYGFRTFAIPRNVGGRFSVLTPAGLLPIACEGVNISKIIEGAAEYRRKTLKRGPEADPSSTYAAARNILYGKGKVVEILASFDPKLYFVSEWWKQLFGESEGKKGKGIFPASCVFTTDLHSMGQLIQEGKRNIFETFVIARRDDEECVVPRGKKDLDGLGYLAGKKVSFINKQAYLATSSAHLKGGVPSMTLFMPEKSPFYLGQLFYFFERAAALSAHILGVNPFDQPGVEAYKSEMRRLLGD